MSANGSYWENGHWVETEPMEIKREYNFPQVGEKDMYLLHHEEIESLAKNVPGVKRIRFFMTFGQSYLTHMKCLENVGMLSTSPILFEGKEIVPIQFLKALLPDPASLGPRTVGKTNIGCIFTGKKEGKEKTIYIYNVCDHQECYKEVGSQAISYTTGVPAMIGAALVVDKVWDKDGVFNIEEFDPDPFMDMLNQYGLPWVVDGKSPSRLVENGMWNRSVRHRAMLWMKAKSEENLEILADLEQECRLSHPAGPESIFHVSACIR